MTRPDDHDLFPPEDLGLVWSPTPAEKQAAREKQERVQVRAAQDVPPPEVWYS